MVWWSGHRIAAREVRGSNLGLGRNFFNLKKSLNRKKKFVTPADRVDEIDRAKLKRPDGSRARRRSQVIELAKQLR